LDSLAYNTGGDLKDIQAQMRHASVNTTANIYTKPIPKRVRKAVEALDRRIILSFSWRSSSGESVWSAYRRRSRHVCFSLRRRWSTNNSLNLAHGFYQTAVTPHQPVAPAGRGGAKILGISNVFGAKKYPACIHDVFAESMIAGGSEFHEP
jgi:hypothetical protein